MKKVLITNASGCIGINLANLLLEDDNTSILGYDDKLSQNTSSIYTLLKNERYNFTEYDLTKEIQEYSDEIYYLTPCINSRLYLDNKYDYILKQFKMLNSILNYASLCGAKIIFANNFLNYNSLNSEFFPLYSAISTMQNMIKVFSDKNHLDFKVAQISNFYGINSYPDKDNFVGDFIFKSFNNESIDIGKNESVYITFARDIAKGLKVIMESYSESNIYDISNPNPCLKSDIAKLIANFTKSKSAITCEDETPEMPSYNPDVSKLNNELNFRCATSILDGVSKTIDFYKMMYFS